MRNRASKMPKWMQILWLLLTGACVVPAQAAVCDLQWSEKLYGINVRPSHDYADFLNGNLGIVSGGLDSAYLFVAWRTLNGFDIPKPLHPAFARHYDCKNERGDLPQGKEVELEAAIKAWKTARAVLNSPVLAEKRYEGYRLADQYDYPQYLNCGPAAFLHAAETLKSRAPAYGDEPAALRNWIDGQDRTFANCQRPVGAPAEPPENAPGWLKRDRAYQRAAALFYMGRHVEAVSAFDAIAKDNATEWRTLAPYLAARALVRHAMRNYRTDLAGLSQAESRLREILRNPDLKKWHGAAVGLLSFITARTDPAGRLLELDKELSGARLGENFVQTLIDHDFILRRPEDKPYQELEFTRWIAALRGAADAAELWRDRGTVVWLVAALASATAADADLKDMLAAAANVPDTSPASTTLRYHQARLLIEEGRKDEARIVLEALERTGQTRLPAPSLNLVRELKLPLARNLREWAASAVRVPNSRLGGRPTYLDKDGAGEVNYALPLEQLARLARMRGLPKYLQEDLVVVAFTRAVLLARHDVARNLAPRLRPIVKGVDGPLDRYLDAAGDASRRVQGALLLAALPGMIIDVSYGLGHEIGRQEISLPYMRRSVAIEQARDNWWCKEWSERSKAAAQPLPFLTQTQRKTLAAEQSTLNALTNGTDDLMKTVLEWARTHPADPNLPRALNMLVRSSRGGCVSRETGDYSKMAYRHLHKHFPGNAWTRKTRYYYGYWGN